VLHTVERRGHARDVVEALLDRDVRDRGFFEHQAPLQGLADQLTTPIRAVTIVRDEEHNSWLLRIDNRATGYSRVDQIRREKKDEFERSGSKLTYTSFIAKVVVDCLRRHKVVNASIDGDNIIYRNDINLGIAVALDNGLIVPVVKGAGEKNILGLSKAIQDVADRARAKKLNPEEVHGGTFTITNPGNFGAQFGLPIINQPQVAILGVGTIEKRPVVIDDMIGIRLMGYLTLGYDHRLIDGAVADQFMASLKTKLESFEI